MNNIIKLFNLLREDQKFKFKLVLVFLFISASLQFAGISTIILVFNIIKAETPNDLNTLFQILYNYFNFAELFFFKKIIISILLAVIALSLMLTLVNYFLISYFSNRFSLELEKKIFSYYLKCDYFFFSKDSNNRLISNFKDHIPRITMYLVPGIFNLVNSISTLITIFVFSLFVDYKISIIIYTLFILIYCLLFFGLKKKLASVTQEIIRSSRFKTEATIDAINNLKIIKFFQDKDLYLFKFFENGYKIVVNSVKLYLIEVSPRVLLDLLLYGGIVAALLIFYDDKSKTLDLEKFIFFAIVASKALPTINHLYTAVIFIKGSSLSLNQIQNEVNILTKDIYVNKTLRKKQLDFQKNIELRNVDFSFSNGSFEFKDLNFKINKGDFIGISGPSGSGKTTFVDLICGIYKPLSGNLLVDGVTMDDRYIDSFRDKISYISQENYLGNINIKEAITLGGLSKNGIDDENIDNRVYNCLKHVDLYNFVNSLPEKIYTKIGEGGIKLSVGQKQRLTLSKIFFSKSEILVLDESTSSIDQITEEKILDELIYNIKKNLQTLIFITHRLKSLKRTNKVLLIKDAKIKFIGDYSDIIDKFGNYIFNEI
jgi:ABC-type multidrug transport system fused ATPase/permease subunit